MRLTLYILLVSFFSLVLSAQEEDYVIPGSVYFQENHGIAQLIEKYRMIHQNNPSLPGFRIQISQEYKSQSVYEKEGEVEKYFPEFRTYVTYNQPYFKLRCGNFVDRLEAFKALKRVRKKFDSAFLVPETIWLSDINY